MNVKNKSAVVLVSGGQDSATCLVWAKQQFDQVLAISFNYGQRHKKELTAAKAICKSLKIPHEVLKVDLLKKLTRNALTDPSVKVALGKNGQLPTTFVDGRNMIFLTVAAIYAKQHDIPNLVTGVCQTDYSGYPDCRDDFIKAEEKTLQLAMVFPFKIHTPLMFLTKAETVKLMQKLGGLPLLKKTLTCYHGQRPACGTCPACVLRLKGFEEAGIPDPITYAKKIR